MSTFSYIFSRTLCIITTHSPSAVSHTPSRLLMPLHHLYTSHGGGSWSLGLTQLGNSSRLSASYHTYLKSECV